jgi:hypothetical protein
MRRRLNPRAFGGVSIVKEYSSFTGFVNDAATGPQHSGAAGWAGCGTLAEAVEIARSGWPEGWQRMKALRDSIFAKMASQVQKDRVQFRIAGGAVNVARFLSGRPDCFAARVRSNQLKDQHSRKVLRMVVNVGARGRVSADTFFARGAAAVTLIEALERAGYRMQVDMISLAIGDSEGRRKVRLSCRIKEAGEVVQLDKLAFCLAHPALHRKLNFALRLKHAGWIGGSIDVPLEDRGDIYIDAADSSASQAWLDPQVAQGWVLSQLARQGVTTRAA